MSDWTAGRPLGYPYPEAPSRALTRRVAALAFRLADVLRTRCSPKSGAHAAAGFLRDWATSVRAATAGAELEALGPGTPVDSLVSRLQLDVVEVELLLLAGLAEEHEGLASTLRTCHPQGEPHPTVGMAFLTVEAGVPDRAVLRRLLHEGRAARSGLLAVTGAGAFFERSLVLADQVWEALHGLDAWPVSLPRVEVAAPPPGLDGWLGLPDVERALTAIVTRQDRLLLVGSGDEVVALSRCSALASAAGEAVVAARVRPDDRAATALLALHAAVRGGLPVIIAGDRREEGPAPTPDLRAVAGPVLLCAAPGAVRPPADRPVLLVPLGPIRTADRRLAWQAALSGAADEAAVLAARHPLDPAVTALVALDVDGTDELRTGPVDLAGVSATIRARAGIELPAGVELMSPRAGWEHLVLGAEPMGQLREAVSRLAHQALVLDDWDLRTTARADRGVRMLFSGPPGTGKSLAAEVLACAVATDLLVVDVSRVVSKWLGETEKNLAAIFDVAERTQAVLFLAEADALCGTRTEISDAHDRYANLETAWLLNRFDCFDGLAILATNMRRNVDAAFVRRMDYTVEFPMPDEAGRAAIWERHVPRERRADDVDLGVLAHRYPVVGAWIRNAAIAAAFAAAASHDAIRQTQLVAALRREYAKATQPFPGEPPAHSDLDRDERAARLLSEVLASRTRRTEMST